MHLARDHNHPRVVSRAIKLSCIYCTIQPMTSPHPWSGQASSTWRSVSNDQRRPQSSAIFPSVVAHRSSIDNILYPSISIAPMMIYLLGTWNETPKQKVSVTMSRLSLGETSYLGWRWEYSIFIAGYAMWCTPGWKWGNGGRGRVGPSIGLLGRQRWPCYILAVCRSYVISVGPASRSRTICRSYVRMECDSYRVRYRRRASREKSVGPM